MKLTILTGSPPATSELEGVLTNGVGALAKLCGHERKIPHFGSSW